MLITANRNQSLSAPRFPLKPAGAFSRPGSTGKFVHLGAVEACHFCFQTGGTFLDFPQPEQTIPSG